MTTPSSQNLWLDQCHLRCAPQATVPRRAKSQKPRGQGAPQLPWLGDPTRGSGRGGGKSVGWPGAQGADPAPMPKEGRVPRGKTAKCRGSAQGPGAPRAGPSPRKQGSVGV
jgi:hypothetical protein